MCIFANSLLFLLVNLRFEYALSTFIVEAGRRTKIKWVK